MYKLYVNLVLLIIIVIFTCYYSLDMKTLYPEVWINICAEPFGRFMLYIIVYCISFYNEVLALLTLIPVVLLHLDIINLLDKKNLGKE